MLSITLRKFRKDLVRSELWTMMALKSNSRRSEENQSLKSQTLWTDLMMLKLNASNHAPKRQRQQDTSTKTQMVKWILVPSISNPPTHLQDHNCLWEPKDQHSTSTMKGMTDIQKAKALVEKKEARAWEEEEPTNTKAVVMTKNLNIMTPNTMTQKKRLRSRDKVSLRKRSWKKLKDSLRTPIYSAKKIWMNFKMNSNPIIQTISNRERSRRIKMSSMSCSNFSLDLEISSLPISSNPLRFLTSSCKSEEWKKCSSTSNRILTWPTCLFFWDTYAYARKQKRSFRTSRETLTFLS